MSREIKFRAWNGIDGSMIEWNTLRANPKLFMDIATGKQRHYLLMQYTGLKDCNGVDIYEGDIVIAKIYPFYGVAPGISEYEGECKELNYVGEVYFSNYDLSFCYKMHVASDRVHGLARGGHLSEVEEWEVIGNIYEHPELLEKKQ